MTEHLLNNTITPHEAKLAAYYARGEIKDELMLGLAEGVAAGEIDHAEAIERLMADWDAKNPEPDSQAFAAAVHERWPFGIPPDVPDPFLPFEADLERWQARRLEVEGRLGNRLGVLVDRIERGILDGPLAVVRPDIDPVVARNLGIEPDAILSNDEINHLLAGLRADGSHVEGKTYAKERPLPPDPRTGAERSSKPLGSMDFTPTPHKSVSVAWGFAGELEQAKILNAHTEAAREAIAYVAGHIGQARVGRGGEDGFVKGKTAWLEFTHHTSRPIRMSVKDGVAVFGQDMTIAADPDVHTHFLVHNSVHCPDGRIGSLDTAQLRGFIFEADALYHARLSELLRTAGFDVVRDARTGSARMLAIPEDACLHFSKRTNMGEAYAQMKAAEKGIDWDALTPDERSDWISNATQDRQQKARGEKDGKANFADWRRQADEIGWQRPASFLAYGPLMPERGPAVIQREAYEISLGILEKQFEQRSVLSSWEVRAAAGQGLIHAGAPAGIADIDAVVKIMAREGVRQYGEQTALRWGLEADGHQTSVSTALHESDEREFIALATAAAVDRSAALPRAAMDRAVRNSRFDFTTEHGKKQLAVIGTLGHGGRLAVGIGSSGAGKTALLSPLTEAWTKAGRDVWGASLAWRQADDLADAGIRPDRVKAFSVLIDGLKDGSIRLSGRSVVAVDELGLLGTRQGLELLRMQDKHGFQIVALGDEKQIRSISAGSIWGLLRQSLGAENMPVINTTLRQQSDREKVIAGLLRNDRPIEALRMKREDGSAEMVPGSAGAVIARVAQRYHERLAASGTAPLVMAPTNQGTLEISQALRLERRQMGLLGADQMTVRATDGERSYPLPLASGDKVRLFKSVGADYGNGHGGPIGRNGKVLEVMEADDRGIVLKNEAGRVGRVLWAKLTDKKTGRILLSYGDVATIHTSQGVTAAVGILALPHGSKALQGGMGYSGLTRHQWAMDLITSRTAEYAEVIQGRAKNDIRPVTDEQCWSVVAQHLLAGKPKDLAVNMIERVTGLRRGTVRGFHEGLQVAAQRQSFGQAPSEVAERVQQQRAGRSHDLRQFAEAMVSKVQAIAIEALRQVREHREQDQQRDFER